MFVNPHPQPVGLGWYRGAPLARKNADEVSHIMLLSKIAHRASPFAPLKFALSFGKLEELAGETPALRTKKRPPLGEGGRL
jgi:hypothetical protein